MDTLKVAVLQPAVTHGDTVKALRITEASLRASAAAGCQMLVAPEMFLPGYNQPDAIKAQAQPADGPWMQALRALCASTGCGLTIGFAERAGDALYNSSCAIDGSGKMLGIYRKIQLFGAKENALYVAGDAYCTFDFHGIKCAMLICYDAEFEHHWNALRARGVQVIFTPSANMQPYENVSNHLLPAHAATTNLTMCYSNYSGPEGDLDFCGLSMIVGLGGHVLAQCGKYPGLIMADIPVRDLRQEPLWATQAMDLRQID